jgi:hypothetical protein
MNIQKARSLIRGAFICGIISSVITLIATSVAVAKGNYQFSGMPISILTFIDVFLMVGLTIGIFLKSRVCAVLMLAYFAWCKYVQLGGMNAFALLSGLVFLYFYAQGVRGAFAYHSAMKTEANQALEPTTHL